MMENVLITKNISILLPNNRVIKIESPQLTEDEFNYFIDILKIQKQGLIEPETQERKSDEI
jgi:hypothetical protein